MSYNNPKLKEQGCDAISSNPVSHLETYNLKTEANSYKDVGGGITTRRQAQFKNVYSLIRQHTDFSTIPNLMYTFSILSSHKRILY